MLSFLFIQTKNIVRGLDLNLYFRKYDSKIELNDIKTMITIKVIEIEYI